MTSSSDLLADRAHSDRPFITDESAAWSFAQLGDLVALRAGELNLRAGDVVGVMPANDVPSIVDALAVWRAGGVVQLLNSRLTPGELLPQLEASGAVGVVGEITGLPVPRVDRKGTERIDRCDSETDHPALIVATSGTSGSPRLVELTWGNLMASATAARDHLRVTPADRWLAVLPLFHVGGFSVIVRALVVGFEVVLRRRFDPRVTARDLHQVSLASLVGSMLPPVLAEDAGPYPGLRAVLVGGGPTSADLLLQAVGAGIPVLSTYGMTETSSQIATAPLGDGAHRRAVPVPGAEIRIAAGGEIEVRGPMVARRYTGEPARTAEAWFATGDIGTIDEDGYLRVIGRKGDLIISGGENVMPLEVEDVIGGLAAVREVAVVGTSDAKWGEMVTAVLVLDQAAAEGTIAEIETAVRARLAGFKVPRRWVTVDALPRNALGKIDRAELHKLVEHADAG